MNIENIWLTSIFVRISCFYFIEYLKAEFYKFVPKAFVLFSFLSCVTTYWCAFFLFMKWDVVFYEWHITARVKKHIYAELGWRHCGWSFKRFTSTDFSYLHRLQCDCTHFFRKKKSDKREKKSNFSLFPFALVGAENISMKMMHHYGLKWWRTAKTLMIYHSLNNF